MAISVSIAAGSSASSTKVTVQGEDGGPIEADQMVPLNLSDPNGLVAAYLGGVPTTTFYCDPCNDGQNWYAQYGWEPVTITRSVTGGSIKSFNTQPIVAHTQECDNRTDQTIQFNPSLSAEVMASVSSSSTQSQKVNVSQEISYDISFLGTGGGGTTSLGYEKTWEKSYSETKEESFNLTLGASIPVPPGRKMVAELMLSRGTIVIEISYLLSISGRIAAGYYHKFRDRHIFGIPVETLLAHSKCPTTVTATETIVIDAYSNASIVVRNALGEVVHVHEPGAIATAILPPLPDEAEAEAAANS